MSKLFRIAAVALIIIGPAKADDVAELKAAIKSMQTAMEKQTREMETQRVKIKALNARLLDMEQPKNKAVKVVAQPQDHPQATKAATEAPHDIAPLQKLLVDTGLDFGGYFRGGTGGTFGGGKQSCFQLPGAFSKYRLGNECDDFLALGLGGVALRGADQSIIYFKTKVEGGVDNAFISRQYSPALTEAWVGAAHVIPGALNSSTIWAGRRANSYLNVDVHMTDFGFLDRAGDGGGIQDVNLGFGNFAYAFFRDTNNQLANGFSVVGTDGAVHNISGVPFAPSNRSVSRHDFRIYDIPVNEDGKLLVQGEIRSADSRSDAFPAGQTPHGGFAATVMHVQDHVFGGKNLFAFQYGQGAAYTMTKFSDDTAGSNIRSIRVLDNLIFQPSPEWSGSFLALVQTGNFPNPLINGSSWVNIVQPTQYLPPISQTWYSVGIRPIYQFTPHIGFTVEVGEDIIVPSGPKQISGNLTVAGGPARTLTKITPALLIRPGPGFFARPELRFFMTHAFWNQAATDAGLIGPNKARNATTFGLQAEMWW